MNKVKLIDVANYAGVSKSTVSQFINGRYEYMSIKTQEKIRLAVAELNYVPNPIARSLKGKKSYNIGIVVKSISGIITNQIIRSIDDYLKKLNYNILIYNTDYIKEQELKSIAILKSMKVDGLIITSSGSINEELNLEEENGLPIVHILREFDGLNSNTVLSDYEKGSEMAGEYLSSLGHSNIAIITKPYTNSPSRVKRVHGCLSALGRSGIQLDENNICFVNNEKETVDCFEKLYNSSNPPSVIFVMYSDITVQLLSYLNKKNISIPDDIQLINFDDFPLVDFFKTPLTVIHQNPHEIGIACAKLLIDKINNPNGDFEDITIPCHLIVRDSTKRL